MITALLYIAEMHMGLEFSAWAYVMPVIVDLGLYVRLSDT